jgi:hypothetical protein
VGGFHHLVAELECEDVNNVILDVTFRSFHHVHCDTCVMSVAYGCCSGVANLKYVPYFFGRLIFVSTNIHDTGFKLSLTLLYIIKVQLSYVSHDHPPPSQCALRKMSAEGEVNYRIQF